MEQKTRALLVPDPGRDTVRVDCLLPAHGSVGPGRVTVRGFVHSIPSGFLPAGTDPGFRSPELAEVPDVAAGIAVWSPEGCSGIALRRSGIAFR